MKCYTYYFLFFLFFLCSCEEDLNVIYHLEVDGYEVEFKFESDSSYVEEFYYNGELKAAGAMRFQKRIGRWVEFYPNGELLWDGYYDNGQRLYPTNFHFFYDSTFFDLEEIENLRRGKEYFFNIRNKEMHPEDVIFGKCHNCNIVHVNPFFCKGRCFKIVVGGLGDSVSFTGYCNVFNLLPILEVSMPILE